MARSSLLISHTQASENIFHGSKQVREEMPQPKKVQKGLWLPREDEGEVSGSIVTQQKQYSPRRCHSSVAFSTPKEHGQCC